MLARMRSDREELEATTLVAKVASSFELSRSHEELADKVTDDSENILVALVVETSSSTSTGPTFEKMSSSTSLFVGWASGSTPENFIFIIMVQLRLL
jgi:hypothetical protein